VLDSASESTGYYRFTDFVKGKKRACSIYKFTGDQLQVKVYTNKFNTSDTLMLHSTWNATLGSRNNALAATTHFNYPQPVMTMDFTGVFNSMTESIFFNIAEDPYNLLAIPYVGSVNVNISIGGTLPIVPSDKIWLIFNTEPLFNGSTYIADNLKYMSKYVLLPAGTSAYRIKNVHPGKYYVYTLIDKNQDGLYLTGDYMNSDFTNSVTVGERQDASVNSRIDLIIP